MKKRDLTGQRFGRLAVVREGEPTPERNSFRNRWLCKCDCGNEVLVRSSGLVSGQTTSCGCYRRECVAAKNYKHGAATRLDTRPEYDVWCGIIKRCTDESSKSYQNYGGRGIKMCLSWRNSFEAFYADMGSRPSPNHSIERNDVNGDYKPSNCRWATLVEQANNKRSNRWYDVGGCPMTAKQIWEKWAKDRIAYSTFLGRLMKGWSLDDAVWTEPNPGGNRHLRVVKSTGYISP